ncbi:MAG: putative phosphohydrolase [Candidatus Gallionella acididurans]|uniref:Putative phosphohydrolase n=1 Tax=Candidatus Gallionella acididurans TaxID=1796491 RepID=A0A139BPX6_9PROT|nr:MAG: putative phosphohydrolase [Candidatus Gallionella acididurans]
MNLLILHLSDIHIRTKDDDILKRGNAIGRAVFKDLSMADGVVVLVTGDIAYSGKRTEYELAKKLFDDVVKCIKSEKDVPVHVLMCPGNHDCDFEAGTPDVRDILVETIRKTRPDEIKDTIISECTSIQNEFSAFRNSFNLTPPCYEHPLWQTHKIIIKDRTVLFHLLNVAWMSKMKEDPSAIVFPIKRFEEVVEMKSDATIVSFHHPMNWFSQASYRPFKQFTKKAAHLILTGHEHTQSAAFIDDTDSGESVAVDGGVLQEEGVKTSRFNVVILDLDKQEYSVEFHEWDGNLYAPIELESAWSSFRRLPEKRQSEFSIAHEFSKQLSDAGARFTHHGKTEDLLLDDVFVYPEMRPLDEDERGRLIIDAAVLRSPDKLERGVLVHGREQYGKTSLLKQLFLSYHERGFVPVFISGGDLNKSTDRELKKIVEKAVSIAYTTQAILPFWQAGVKRRVLLIDDLDDTELSGEYFSAALKYLNTVFGLMIISCSEMFEFREYVSPNSFDVLNKFDNYTLMEFGYKRRLDLINRWTRLGGNMYSPERTIALIDHVEKLLTSVIGEGVVPSTPFFMLTLLQTVEAGSRTNLQQSALGDYYRYLIIHSLEIQSVSREEHGEILNYCAHLAWHISHPKKHRISAATFEQFHDSFNEQQILSLNFHKREHLLLDAKLIEKLDGEYDFAYPYLYYFFLGKYLADHLDSEEVQALIRKCCLNLHSNDYSNIILFLAHHSRDKRVYESILSVLQNHFTKHVPINLDNDVGVVNQLVESTPDLIYVHSDPLENRVETRKLQDESEVERQGVIGRASTLPPELIELISLLKTVDILGQFLRNHYGDLAGQTKEHLLKELIDGSLRGLREVLELLVANSEGLIKSIEGVLEKRGIENDQKRRNARAKGEMFELLGMITLGFIRRCGVSVASPHLARLIGGVVEKNPTTAYRLVLSTIDLERQGGLNDLSRLHILNQDIKDNAFAQWILRQQVLIHMHMYSTTLAQKQRICAELDIKIHDQQRIDFMLKDSKRI